MAATENRPITAATRTEDGIAVVTELEACRLRLRQRWELASVFNFLKVFEPVLKSKLKISAEEIEMGLFEPNNLLSQLHIMLLQGIPPVSKTLNGSDAWVAALSKKLSPWWPWVAEGDFPLTAAKGEEMIGYREIDPIVRLMILKALCELRADQDDIVSFINDEIKSGAEPSAFRKNSIGRDGNGTSYWYDGSTVVGHRLYKEVNTFHSKSKVKGSRDVPTGPIVNCQWETLATNLEEFNRVVDEFTSSKSMLEVAVGKAVETEAIPALNKLQKKREKELKQQERQQRLLTGFRTSGITRSCRNRRPITYTFDAYDKAIDEAIRQTKKRKTNEDHKHTRIVTAPNEASDPDPKSRASELTETDTDTDTDTDTESDRIKGDDAEGTSSEEDYSSEKEDNDTDKENKNPSNRDNAKLRPKNQDWPKGSRRSKRVADIAPSPVPDIKKLGAKNSLRQRPNHNTAFESAIVPDSEDEGSPS